MLSSMTERASWAGLLPSYGRARLACIAMPTGFDVAVAHAGKPAASPATAVVRIGADADATPKGSLAWSPPV